jgi:prepilin-type N-terminal cleavage/methylation domain-containing protein
VTLEAGPQPPRPTEGRDAAALDIGGEAAASRLWRVRRLRSGMTLVELLVSMALLASLAGLIVQLLRNSFDLYAAGERRGEFAANAIVVIDRLEDDLRNVVTGPGGRFVLEQRSSGSPQVWLRLIRTPPQGESEHRTLRAAGTRAQAAGVYVGRDPGPESRPSIGPPSGLLEVCYALVQDPELEPGLLTLYRGERAPALVPGATFFEVDGEAPDAARAKVTLTPVASGILYLKLLCRGPGVADWNEAEVLEGSGDADAALGAWDSTRGMLSKATFAFAAGEDSLADGRDDFYPSHVRAVLVMGRVGRPDAHLTRRLPPGEKDLTVDRADRLPRATDDDRFFKVGGEWMEASANEAWGATVSRGRRRTGTTNVYDVGTPVFAGKTFRKTFELPASPAPARRPVR